MKSPNKTRAASNEGLTKKSAKNSNVATSLLCVSTAGRGAVSVEAAPAFFGSSKPVGERDVLKKRHPAFAGRRAGDAITGGVMTRFYNLASQQSSTKSAGFQAT